MTRLSPAQIAGYAKAAGFTGTGLRDAIAVALAESGGNPAAVNVNHDRYHSRDRGLWQINDHWHPEVSDAEAFNPASAARAAFQISNGGRSWSAWSTWNSGAAAAHFGTATMAAHQSGGVQAEPAGFSLPSPLGGWSPGGIIGGGLGSGLGDVGKGLGDVGKTLAAPILLMVEAGAWIADPHNWLRVAMVTAGTAGVLVSLHMIAQSGAAGSTAQQIAAIPGRAVKSATKAGAEAAVIA